MITGILGGIMGIAGSAISSGIKYVEKKQEINAKIKIAEITGASNIEMAKIETLAKTLLGSYEHDTKGDVSTWVNNIKQLMRPFLTLYLLIDSTVIWCTLMSEPILTPTQILMASAKIEINYMVLSWWFLDRGISKARNLYSRR